MGPKKEQSILKPKGTSMASPVPNDSQPCCFCGRSIRHTFSAALYIVFESGGGGGGGVNEVWGKGGKKQQPQPRYNPLTFSLRDMCINWFAMIF